MRALFRSLIFVLVASVSIGYAQQDAHFSQYMFSPLSYNPAYAGIVNTEFTLIHRSQWLGYNPTKNSGKAPTTQYFGAMAPVSFLHGGLGLVALNDNIGNLQNFSGRLNYAYHIKVKEAKLSLGVAGGLYSLGSLARYVFVDQNDPNINTSDFQQIRPDVSAGLLYHVTNFYLGVGANHINSPKFKTGAGYYTAIGMHYYLSGGYTLDLGDRLQFKPSFLFKSDSKPKNLSFDVNALFEINSKYWAGLGFRHQEAAIAMVGISLLRNNALKVGYAFDFVAYGRGAKAPTSHELMLSYVIPPSLSINKPIIRTPRYRYN